MKDLYPFDAASLQTVSTTSAFFPLIRAHGEFSAALL
jgi:hypothetical protein